MSSFNKYIDSLDGTNYATFNESPSHSDDEDLMCHLSSDSDTDFESNELFNDFKINDISFQVDNKNLGTYINEWMSQSNKLYLKNKKLLLMLTTITVHLACCVCLSHLCSQMP